MQFLFVKHLFAFSTAAVESIRKLSKSSFVRFDWSHRRRLGLGANLRFGSGQVLKCHLSGLREAFRNRREPCSQTNARKSPFYGWRTAQRRVLGGQWLRWFAFLAPTCVSLTDRLWPRVGGRGPDVLKVFPSKWKAPVILIPRLAFISNFNATRLKCSLMPLDCTSRVDFKAQVWPNPLKQPSKE